jgi:hypothetical protein
MSLTAEQLRFLSDKGMTLEDVIAFAELAGRPKSKGAERTARWRANKAANVTSDVTRDASPPPNDNNSNPPTNPISSEIVSKPRRKSVGDGMPEGWEPVLTPAAQRVVDGWPPGMFERTLSGFRNHAADKGRKSKDWQAAFRTWIDNADKWKPKNDNPASNNELQNPYVRAVARREADRAGIGF